MAPSSRAEEGRARIIGEVADGSPVPESPKPVLPEFTVEHTSVLNKGGRKISLERVIDPDIKMPSKPRTRTNPYPAIGIPTQAVNVGQAQEGTKTVLVMISATVFDHEHTFLRWTVMGHEGKAEEFEAWSNLDFHHFTGFTSYEVDGIQFGLIMGIGDSTGGADEKRVLRGLPKLSKDKPSYKITKGDRSNLEAVTLIRGLHELYREEGSLLERAYRGRERARIAQEAEMKANPPKPRDVTIRFWLGGRKGGDK